MTIATATMITTPMAEMVGIRAAGTMVGTTTMIMTGIVVIATLPYKQPMNTATVAKRRMPGSMPAWSASPRRKKQGQPAEANIIESNSSQSP